MTTSRIRRFLACGALCSGLVLPLGVFAAPPGTISWLSAQVLGVAGGIDAFFKLAATATDRLLASLILTGAPPSPSPVDETIFAIEPGGKLPAKLAAATTTATTPPAPSPKTGSPPAPPAVSPAPPRTTAEEIARLTAAASELTRGVDVLRAAYSPPVTWVTQSFQPALPNLLKNLTNPIVDGSLTMTNGTLNLSATQGSISITTGTLSVGGFSVTNANGSTTMQIPGNGQFDTLNVGIGTMGPGAQLQVNIGAAATKGLVVKGAASQTANLQEWQDSTGTVRTVISPRGAIGINTATPGINYASVSDAEAGTLDIYGVIGGSLGGTSQIRLLPKSTGIGRWLLVGLGDDWLQTARRGNFEFYDLDTTKPRFIIDSAGRMGINTGYTQPFTAALTVFSTVTTMPTMYIKAVAGQTADLTQWQNSFGNALVVINSSGNVGIGTSQPSSTLHVAGNVIVTATSSLIGKVIIASSSAAAFNGATSTLTVCALSNCTKPSAATSTDTVAFFASTDGTTAGTSIIARGVITSGQADIGEYVQVLGNEWEYDAGDLLSVVTSSAVLFGKSSGSYDPHLAGVVTKTAGFIAGGGESSHSNIVITLAGRVPVKVSLENGPIHVGDLVTASSKPGVGMKATDPGQTLGMALTAFTPEIQATSSDVVGTVMVFVHPGWNIGSVGEETAGSTMLSTLSGGLRQFAAAVQHALSKLGLVIQDGIARVKELFAEKVTTTVVQTDMLCVGDTCVNRDQLSALLGASSIAPVFAPAPAAAEAPAGTPAGEPAPPPPAPLTSTSGAEATTTATSSPSGAPVTSGADAGSSTTIASTTGATAVPPSSEPTPTPSSDTSSAPAADTGTTVPETGNTLSPSAPESTTP